MQNPEPRFYPSYHLRIDDYDVWRAMDRGECASISWGFINDIRRLQMERIREIHPDWNESQHNLMFFKLRYRGENFELFCAAKIKRGDFTPAEVEAVRAVPIPTERADALRYAGISYPLLDEDALFWP